MNLSKTIIRKIEQGTVQPKTKGFFLFQHVIIWIVFLMIIFIGSVSISFIFFELSLPEHIASRVQGSKLFVLNIFLLPSIWILLTVIFILIATRVFAQTDYGYKIEYKYVFIVLLLLSTIGGSILYLTSATDMFHEILRKNKPYDRMRVQNEQRNIGPEKGVLLGQIQSKDGTYILKSRTSEWVLDVTTCQKCMNAWSEERRASRPHLVFGSISQTDTSIFVVQDTRPAKKRKRR